MQYLQLKCYSKRWSM